MPKTKRKRSRRPFTDAQVAAVRSIVREEIANGYVPSYTDEMLKPIAAVVSIEDVIGEAEIDKARRKLEAGIDLTPTTFPLPPGASYFGRDDEGHELKPGFTDSYLQHLNAGEDPRDAYVKTCGEYNLPVYERAS